MKRRNLLAGLGAGLVAGCSKIGQSDPMQKLFGWAEDWHMGTHRAMAVDVHLETQEAAALAAPGTAPLTLWTALLLAFVGGLILNLMPCVFPVLSIKILGFAQGRTTERAVLAGAVETLWVIEPSIVPPPRSGRCGPGAVPHRHR